MTGVREPMDGRVERFGERLRVARSVAVLTGAGISTDSGIPDFRGPRGRWRTDPTTERLTHWPSYRDDPDVRRRSWAWRIASPAVGASPNAAHRALVRLADAGRLRGVATQNVDGLHLDAGLPEELVAELHGTARRVECTGCDWTAEIGWAVERVRDGDRDPRCPACGAITKAATVFFGQQLPNLALARAEQAALECDLYVAIGTSLRVTPAAGLPMIALAEGIPLVIVNAEPTPLDHLATLLVRAPIGEAVPAAIDLALADS